MSTKWKDAPLSNYQIHRISNAEAGYNYYLYIHALGQGIIMREKADETEYLYTDGGYSGSKWSNRTILDYDTYDKLVR